MSRKYKFHEPDKLYFVTYSVVYWIELFIRNQYKNILLDSWDFCRKNKGMELYGWCIMTSHAHMIIGSQVNNLSDIMRDMKRHTSKSLIDAVSSSCCESRKDWLLDLFLKAGNCNKHNNELQLWQQDCHPIQLSTPKIAHQKLDYMHCNPVVAGFVDKPEDYLYSSARDYLGKTGLIGITLLDPLYL